MSRPLQIMIINRLDDYLLPTELHEAQAALKDERTKVQLKDSRIQELESTVEELTSRTNQQQQAISLLVSEKATLTASVERLGDAETSSSKACYRSG